MKYLFILFSIVILVFSCAVTPSQTVRETTAQAKPGIIAFPGADGMGKFTVGGRGGKIIEVTNLLDDGPGSLRAAVTSKGPRIVVFRVSGIIELAAPLVIAEPCITIAGQSAPGDGICLKNYVVRIFADQVIIRFIRVRLGVDSQQESDCIDVSKGQNIIIDHVSASWSVDETLSVSSTNSVRNLTVQWCFITESLNKSLHVKGNHGYGSLIRGGYGAGYTYHHNLYAHHRARNPRPGNYSNTTKDPNGLFFEFSNNVVYDFGGDYAGYNMDKDTLTSVNFIGNYYLAGPNSTGNLAYMEFCGKAVSFFRDNYMNGEKPADPWSLVGFDASFSGDPASYKQAAPVPMEQNIASEDGAVAFRKILAYGGASIPKRDSIDIRIVREVNTKSGSIVDNVTDVGGYPEYKSTDAPVDSDHDGMPDVWEKANKLDPVRDDSAGDLNNDGFTNIEDYLNSLVVFAM